MLITLTGDIECHGAGFLATIDGLGLHAYGATEDEAYGRAGIAIQMKIDLLMEVGDLETFLVVLGIEYEHPPRYRFVASDLEERYDEEMRGSLLRFPLRLEMSREQAPV